MSLLKSYTKLINMKKKKIPTDTHTKLINMKKAYKQKSQTYN